MIGGMVLAAGGSRRFGAPKQLAELHGRPLLEHAVAAMVAVPALERIVVVLGARAQQVRAEVDTFDAEVVECAQWQEGMAASLRCGVAALQDCDALLVTLGDQPLITPQVIAGVLDHAGGGYAAVRATYGGAPGHPVLLGRELYPSLLALTGDSGARDLLAGTRVREWECGHLARADDIDTVEDLEGVRT